MCFGSQRALPHRVNRFDDTILSTPNFAGDICSPTRLDHRQSLMKTLSVILTCRWMKYYRRNLALMKSCRQSDCRWGTGDLCVFATGENKTKISRGKKVTKTNLYLAFVFFSFVSIEIYKCVRIHTVDIFDLALTVQICSSKSKTFWESFTN